MCVSFSMYVFENLNTLAEIKRTVEEKSRPIGSRITGMEIVKEGSIMIFHSMITVFVFIVNHSAGRSVIRARAHRIFLDTFETLNE